MPYDTLELTDQEVLCQVQDHLEKALPLHAEGTTCTTDDLFKVLLSGRRTIPSYYAEIHPN